MFCFQRRNRMTRFALISSLFFCFTAVTLNAQVPHFQHVVVIVQENRTPDNMFQGLCAPPYGSSQSCSITPGPGQYNIQTSDWYDKSSDKGVTQPKPATLTAKYDLSQRHFSQGHSWRFLWVRSGCARVWRLERD